MQGKSSQKCGPRPSVTRNRRNSSRVRSERAAARPPRPSRCHRTPPLRAPSEPRVAHPQSQVSRLHAPLPGWRARLLLLAFSAGRVPFQSAADRPQRPRIGRETLAWLCTAQACDGRKKKCRARTSVCSLVYYCRGRDLSHCTLHTLESIWCYCCYVSMSFTDPP